MGTIITILRTDAIENKAAIDRIESSVFKGVRKRKLFAYEENAEPMTVIENAERSYIEYPSFVEVILNSSLRIYAKRPGDKYPSAVFNISPGNVKTSIKADKVSEYIDDPDRISVLEIEAPSVICKKYNVKEGASMSELLDTMGGRMANMTSPRSMEEIIKDIVKAYSCVMYVKSTSPVRIKGKNRFNGTVEADPVDLKSLINVMKSDIKALTTKRPSPKFEPEFDRAKVTQHAFRNINDYVKIVNELPDENKASSIISGLLDGEKQA